MLDSEMVVNDEENAVDSRTEGKNLLIDMQPASYLAIC